MKTLPLTRFCQIRSYMNRNARHREWAAWRYFIEGQDSAAYRDAISAYQNDDGGFALWDDDLWNPHSSPAITGLASSALLEIDLPSDDPIVRGVLGYLASGPHVTDCGWAFTVPSNDHYPHRPWYAHTKENAAQWSHWTDAKLTGFILRKAPEGGDLYAKAMRQCPRLLARLAATDLNGVLPFFSIDTMQDLLDNIEKAGLSQAIPTASWRERLRELVDSTLEKDPAKWKEWWRAKPSCYIKSPHSPFYEAYRDLMDAELDEIVVRRTNETIGKLGDADVAPGDPYAKEWTVGLFFHIAGTAQLEMKLLKRFGRIAFEPETPQ